MAQRSKDLVNWQRGSAQDTSTRRTPCCGQDTRGTRACTIVTNDPQSK